MRNETIAYTIDRAVNTNFYISVQNGEISVKAPWYLSTQEIQTRVEEKRTWIIAKLQECREKQIDSLSIKCVKIWGIDYNVKVLYKFCKLPTLNVEDKNINIILPTKYKRMNKESILEILIRKMYEKIAQEEIENVMEKTRVLLGFAPEDYMVKSIGNKLGECSRENIITINPEIVKYNKKILEYVVLHEYCHIQYKNHTKGFKELIRKYMPNYEEYEMAIKEYKY